MCIRDSDTTNILFIVGGAFDGIENIVKNRLGKKTIGFGAENGLNQVDADDWQKNLTTGDLVKFGLIPEFIGRIPIITTPVSYTHLRLIADLICGIKITSIK